MRIAFDTGGTFTDCVYLRGGRIEILKIPSTPQNPAETISRALGEITRESREGVSTRSCLGRHELK